MYLLYHKKVDILARKLAVDVVSGSECELLAEEVSDSGVFIGVTASLVGGAGGLAVDISVIGKAVEVFDSVWALVFACAPSPSTNTRSNSAKNSHYQNRSGLCYLAHPLLVLR